MAFFGTSLLIVYMLTQPITADIRSRLCYNSSTAVDSKELLQGQHITIAFYDGETLECDRTTFPKKCSRYGIAKSNENVWSGYEVEMWERLAEIGNFTYDIISMGPTEEINGKNYTYTMAAMDILNVTGNRSDVAADILGQGTWRADKNRTGDFVWSAPIMTQFSRLLVRAPRIKEQSFAERALLLFKPFEGEVWACLFVSLFIVNGIFAAMTRRNIDTKYETSTADILHSLCMSIIGKSSMAKYDHRQIKGLALAWYFYIFLISAIYTSNLTAILSLPPTLVPTYLTWQDVKHSGKSMCLLQGTSNEALFKDTLAGLDIKPVANITKVIEHVIEEPENCAASAITREDLELWIKKKDNKYDVCQIQFATTPIAKRYRAMMTKLELACVITAVNALYQEFLLRECRGADRCNEEELYKHYFPFDPASFQNCDPFHAKQETADDKSLGLWDLVGPFILLGGGVLVFGLFSLLGQYYYNHPSERLIKWKLMRKFHDNDIEKNNRDPLSRLRQWASRGKNDEERREGSENPSDEAPVERVDKIDDETQELINKSLESLTKLKNRFSSRQQELEVQSQQPGPMKKEDISQESKTKKAETHITLV
eukprot:m.301599 g.301599  ORF g.301599 m.301599 type:complete len:600 (-) comp16427_c0_seq2:20-1819(-)